MREDCPIVSSLLPSLSPLFAPVDVGEDRGGIAGNVRKQPLHCCEPIWRARAHETSAKSGSRLTWRKLRAMWVDWTSERAQEGQDCGNEHTLMRQRGQRKPPEVRLLWQAQRLGWASSVREGNPIRRRVAWVLSAAPADGSGSGPVANDDDGCRRVVAGGYVVCLRS